MRMRAGQLCFWRQNYLWSSILISYNPPLVLHSTDNAIKANTVSCNNGTTKSCILMVESLLPESSQPSTHHWVRIYTPEIQGFGEQQLSVRFHLCAKQVPFSGRNWTPILSGRASAVVQPSKKWDWGWQINFGPGFGLRRSPVRRCPQELHLPALLPVFHFCYFVIFFLAFQYM